MLNTVLSAVGIPWTDRVSFSFFPGFYVQLQEDQTLQAGFIAGGGLVGLLVGAMRGRFFKKLGRRKEEGWRRSFIDRRSIFGKVKTPPRDSFLRRQSQVSKGKEQKVYFFSLFSFANGSYRRFFLKKCSFSKHPLFFSLLPRSVLHGPWRRRRRRGVLPARGPRSRRHRRPGGAGVRKDRVELRRGR